MRLPLLATLLLTTLLPLPASASGEAPLARRGVLGLALVPAADGRATIQGVAPGGAAERAGLQAGDVVVTVDGAAVADIPQLLARITAVKAGGDVALGLANPGRPPLLTLRAAPAPLEQGEHFSTDYGVVEAAGLRLRRLLTLPKTGDGPFPTLMIVQGLGCFSVDNEPAANPTYRPIIEALSQQGYATLRIDKPGTGDSEGGPCEAVDFETELAGYRAGLASLQDDPRVDPAQLFVFGHSMGGIMMPSLVDGFDVAGVAVYGSGFKSWLQYQLDSVRRQKALEGLPPPMVDAAGRDAEQLAAHLLVLGWSLQQFRDEFPAAAAGYPHGETLFGGKPVRYFQQLHGHRLPQEWAEVDTQVLALYGAADFVSFEDDHRGIVDTVNHARPGRAELRVLPGIDHWFRQAGDFAASRQQAGQGPYNPVMIETLAEWLQSVRG